MSDALADRPGRETSREREFGPPTPHRPWWSVRWPLALFALALATRVFFDVFVRSGGSFDALPDQREYFESAFRIKSGYGSSFVDPAFWQGVYAFRMPGYPLFLVLAGDDYRGIATVQAFLDAAGTLVVLRIGRRLGNEWIGRSAAIAVALNPYLIYFSSLILSETLFSLLLILALIALLSRRMIWWGLGVCVLIGSIYVRPSAVGLATIAAIAAFGTNGGGKFQVKRSVMAGLLAGLLTVVALWPWALRNERLLGERIWLTTNDGFTAYDSFNPQADGSSNQAFFRAEPRLLEMREVGRSRYLKQKALDYAMSHPDRVITLAFAKLTRFWSPIPLSADFGGRWLYVIVGGVYVVPLFVFAAIGAWRGKLPRRAKLILLLPAIYFSAVHCVFVGSLRYRVPCDVPLAVLAAAGVMSFVKSNTADGPAVAA